MSKPMAEEHGGIEELVKRFEDAVLTRADALREFMRSNDDAVSDRHEAALDKADEALDAAREALRSHLGASQPVERCCARCHIAVVENGHLCDPCLNAASREWSPGASQPSASGEPVAWMVEWEYDTGARLHHFILGDQPELARHHLAFVARDRGFKFGTVRALGDLRATQPSGSGTESHQPSEQEREP